jgi:hypothetical protein
MKCPECGCSWISVLESRHTSEKAISRRRQCKGCNHIWATAEVPVPHGEWGYKNTARFNGRDKAEFGVKARMLERLASA